MYYDPYPALLIFASDPPPSILCSCDPVQPDPHPHFFIDLYFIDLAIIRQPGLHAPFSTLDTLTAQASHTTWALLTDRASLNPPSLSTSDRRPPLPYASSHATTTTIQHTFTSFFRLFLPGFESCPPFILKLNLLTFDVDTLFYYLVLPSSIVYI
jgi:hypothetical protein